MRMPVFMFQLGGLYTRCGQRIVAVEMPSEDAQGRRVQFVDLDRGIDGVAHVHDDHVEDLNFDVVQHAVRQAYLMGKEEYWVNSDRDIANKLYKLAGIDL